MSLIGVEANNDAEEALHDLLAIRDRLPVHLGCKRSLKPRQFEGAFIGRQMTVLYVESKLPSASRLLPVDSRTMEVSYSLVHVLQPRRQRLLQHSTRPMQSHFHI